MRKRLALAALGLAAILTALPARAQPAAAPAAQFFPVLVYRTGAYAPNGAPWANGYVDYLKLIQAQGGIDGVPLRWEECEFGYATDRGVECYERLKGKHGGATLFQPLSTGVTLALTEKAPLDRIPLITAGYGRSESQDGGVFPWVFPLLGSYWVAADTLLQHIAGRAGGWAQLKGKKIALVHLDSPYGKEPIPLLSERSRRHGFTLSLIPVPHPGIEQKSAWLQIRRERPDYVLLWGWGAMNTASLKEAQATGYPRERMVGVWWAGAEPDVKDVADGAKGYSALALQHSAHPDAPVVQQVLARVHDQGQGTGPRAEVGQVLYLRGLISAMLAVEGVRRAQQRFGRGRVMSADQVRWGLENLALSQERLDRLGFAGVMRPVHTSCQDHMGAAWARVHTWNGRQWVLAADWLQADASLLQPLVRQAADRYAAERRLTRRPPADCQR